MEAIVITAIICATLIILTALARGKKTNASESPVQQIFKGKAKD